MRSRKANWLQDKRKQEVSLRDKLSDNFLRAFESDFEKNGVDAIQALREKSPEKFCEIAARLIAATEPKPESFKAARSVDEIAIALLKSVGLAETQITPDMIAQAIEANETLIARLEQIRDLAQGTESQDAIQ